MDKKFLIVPINKPIEQRGGGGGGQFSSQAISCTLDADGKIMAINNYPADKYRWGIYDSEDKKYSFLSEWSEHNRIDFPEITKDSTYKLRAFVLVSGIHSSDTFYRFRFRNYNSIYKITRYHVPNCPVCGDLLESVNSGQRCKQCDCGARTRSLVPFVEEYLKNEILTLCESKKPLLSFAMTLNERKILSSFFNNFKSVSLYGNYGSSHECGVDIRDLSRYVSNSFSGVFGCSIFDYFLEHECALRECFRVIAPGGIFFTHIAPSRVVGGNAAPLLKGTKKLRPGHYIPGDVKTPSVEVGRDWFFDAMKRAGFKPAIVQVQDAIPGFVSEWFVGIKPGMIN